MSTPPMKTPSVSLGYVLLYVADVAASLTFYEKAFGLERRFFHDDDGKAYGELETGATRLGFVSLAQVATLLPAPPVMPERTGRVIGAEVGFVTSAVAETFRHAVSQGATAYVEPVTKPWGQEVAYVRDPDGHLIEICSPM